MQANACHLRKNTSCSTGSAKGQDHERAVSLWCLLGAARHLQQRHDICICLQVTGNGCVIMLSSCLPLMTMASR